METITQADVKSPSNRYEGSSEFPEPLDGGESQLLDIPPHKRKAGVTIDVNDYSPKHSSQFVTPRQEMLRQVRANTFFKLPGTEDPRKKKPRNQVTSPTCQASIKTRM
jgi:hypothetical protein